MSRSGTQTVAEVSYSDAVDTPPGSTVPYQMHQRSFTSTSGSGYTTWYFAKSDNSISSPPTIPQVRTGHLYVHLNSSTNVYHYWMMGANNSGRAFRREHNTHSTTTGPAIRGNGEPSWVTRAMTTTTQTRKARSEREMSLHPPL